MIEDTITAIQTIGLIVLVISIWVAIPIIAVILSVLFCSIVAVLGFKEYLVYKREEKED